MSLFQKRNACMLTAILILVILMFGENIWNALHMHYSSINAVASSPCTPLAAMDREHASICIFIPSYHRPHNLKRSLPYFDSLGIISQVVVAHGDEQYFDDSVQSAKIKHVKDWHNNDRYYTVRRFLTSVQHCNVEHILIVDDDILLSKDYIEKLWTAYSSDTQNVYGGAARHCSKYRAYSSHLTANTPYNIVLSGMMLTSKRVLDTVSTAFQNSSFLHTVLAYRGNGEDLLFNYFFIKLYAKRPVHVAVMEGDLTELDQGGGFYRSAREQHMQQRNAMCKRFYPDTNDGKSFLAGFWHKIQDTGD